MIKNSRSLLQFGLALSLSIAVVGCTSALGPPGPRDADRNPPLLGDASYLYVQYSSTGSFVLVGDGDPNHYTLTLSDVVPVTTYFSERPERIAGTLSIEEFIGIEDLFDAEDPPNAAVTAINPTDGTEGIVIVELRDPVYDWQLDNLFYDVILLEESDSRGLGPWQRQSGEALPRNLERINVFIDSDRCPGTVNPQCTD